MPTGLALTGQTSVNWKGLFLQSGLFLGIQHGFRLATEPGTREGMKGPFFDNYARSVGNLHGWADGDEFYVNYIGHPIQGAVAGFLFTQNDKTRFKYVEFGKKRDYWKSRLRATAFSALYSAQFELGPMSEATVGSIQTRFPQQGFVDLVATPAFDLGWMIAEDALDKYFIKWLEGRFRNPYVMVLVRGGLNPTRSFANVLRFKVPWHRDTRPGLFGADHQGEAVQKYLGSGKPGHPELDPRWRKEAEAAISPFEFDLTFQPSFYLGGQGGSCLGGGGTGAFRVASRWQAVMDIGGCNLMGLSSGWSGDSLHYLGGVRSTPFSSNRWNSHFQILAGGNKITHELMNPEKKVMLYEAWHTGGRIPDQEPVHSQYTVRSEANAFALQTGAGLSYRMNSALQWKLASLDYRYSWLPLLDGRNYRSSLSLTTGLTLRMGSW